MPCRWVGGWVGVLLGGGISKEMGGWVDLPRSLSLSLHTYRQHQQRPPKRRAGAPNDLGKAKPGLNHTLSKGVLVASQLTFHYYPLPERDHPIALACVKVNVMNELREALGWEKRGGGGGGTGRRSWLSPSQSDLSFTYLHGPSTAARTFASSQIPTPI